MINTSSVLPPAIREEVNREPAVVALARNAPAAMAGQSPFPHSRNRAAFATLRPSLAATDCLARLNEPLLLEQDQVRMRHLRGGDDKAYLETNQISLPGRGLNRGGTSCSIFRESPSSFAPRPSYSA